MKLHITWAVLFFVVLLGFLLGGYYYAQDSEKLQSLIDSQRQELADMQIKHLEQLQEINQALVAYQEGTAQESKELEQLLSRQESQFKTQIKDLERKKEISEQLLTSTNEDLADNLEELTDKIFSLESNSKADVVRKWDDITVRIECTFEKQERSFGSGLYFGPTSPVDFGAGNEHTILTNSHVLEENDETPTACTIIWSSGQETELVFEQEESGVSRTSYFEGFDAAFLTLTEGEVSRIGLDTTVQYDLCSIAPQSGDEVLILGYPRIGSTESITSTEGIISGYDGNFFITSAKISKGNSGGAAISVKNDCYFGIPTLVKADEVESLGRILDITNIFE